MSSPLKDLYSKDFYDKFSETLEIVVPAFEKKPFTQRIFDDTWPSKELKDRMRHTSKVLHSFLPADFKKAAVLVERIIQNLRERKITESSLEYMFLPDYIETYGINDYESSVRLMEYVTQFTSCEFAVRPFIVKYPDRMLQQMQQWSLHDSYHVRRFASEGSRPRLPWAIALSELKRNPEPIIPILDNLKNDPSEYVRRSVANSINDISKDNPNIVISLVKKWKGLSTNTDAVLKHASRTLLKQGNPLVLELFGVASTASIISKDFNITTPIVKIGDSLEFSFSIHNTEPSPLNVRIEYGVHYLLNSGKHSKKVFKISERQMSPGERIDVRRKQSFRVITTKKFYEGQHKLSVIINGEEREMGAFELMDDGV